MDRQNSSKTKIQQNIMNNFILFNKAEFNEKQREDLINKKEALPDGSFPIRNEQDLKNAIHSIGRSKDYNKAKSWIKKRAKALDKENLLPSEWKEKANED